MMIDHTHLLANAKEMAVGADAEVKYRAAASRAYYAFFHTARAIAKGLALPESGQEIYTSHAALFAQLAGCEKHHTPENMLVRRLAYRARSSTKNNRNHADYELHKPFLPEQASDLMADADFADTIHKKLFA